MQNPIKTSLEETNLSRATIEAMWAIYEPFYNYSKEDFTVRITRNTHFAIYRQGGKIVGFTGIRIEKANLQGMNYLLIYFGQAVITPQVRGTGLINITAFMILRKYWQCLFNHQLIFWADALSFRSYLIFAKNLKEFYPNAKAAMPDQYLKLQQFIGRKYYPERFCAQSGTIHKEQNLVRDQSAQITEEHLLDADIAFFNKVNGHHRDGAGLLTLAPVHAFNVLFMIRKRIIKALSKRAPASAAILTRRLRTN